MTMKWMAIVATASTGSPAPQAMPSAAVSQTEAAVVRPRTMSRRMKITPPPMNPIPDTTWAATRDGSMTIRPFDRTSMKPYFEKSRRRWLQMRSPRPETTRGTLNVTLAAHKVFLAERLGDEPLWKTVDRVVGRAAATPG